MSIWVWALIIFVFSAHGVVQMWMNVTKISAFSLHCNAQLFSLSKKPGRDFFPRQCPLRNRCKVAHIFFSKRLHPTLYPGQIIYKSSGARPKKASVRRSLSHQPKFHHRSLLYYVPSVSMQFCPRSRWIVFVSLQGGYKNITWIFQLTQRERRILYVRSLLLCAGIITHTVRSGQVVWIFISHSAVPQLPEHKWKRRKNQYSLHTGIGRIVMHHPHHAMRSLPI